MTLRDRIRAFLGLPAIEDSVKRLNEDMLKQAERHQALLNALEAINYKRSIAAAKPEPILDWEAQQAAFLNDPANFKEEN